MVAAIAAVDINWGIGYNGDLLDNIPEDRKLPTNNTSGVKGVYYSNYHHRWIADITREGKRIVRSFYKKEDAIKCRKNFENKLQNEFSYDNSQRKYKECLQ